MIAAFDLAAALKAIGAICSLGVIAATWGRSWLEDRSVKKTVAQVHAIRKVYEALQRTLDHTGSLRVLMLALTNGDGAPRVDAVRHSSVLFELHDKGVLPMAPDWQRQRVDDEYQRMLCDVRSKEVISLNVEDLREGSDLRNIYEAAGIRWSLVARLGIARRRFWSGHRPIAWLYLVANFTREDGPKPEDFNAIRSCRSRIQQIMAQSDIVAV